MNRPLATRPALYGDRTRWGLLHGDALELLGRLPARSVDTVVTDPPYGIGFGGHAWDSSGLQDGAAFERWTSVWAHQLQRVLRPGGWIAAFGAPRTMHRLICGMEDAGLEIRDQVLWIYGSGLPKSRRLPGDQGTALKPAYEPVLLARAALDGTTPQTLERWGTGVLDIGATRVQDEVRSGAAAGETPARWPANLGLIHASGCNRRHCDESCVVRQLDGQAGRDVTRFFYAAKASREEREAGLMDQPMIEADIFAQRGRRRVCANVHPTVKPLAVMRWLVRLTAPAGGVVLDPFLGSGSTGCAALLEGRQFFGIERQADYVEIARRRLRHWAGT